MEKDLERLETECLLSALKRKDIRTVKALVTLAMLRPLPTPPLPETAKGAKE